MGNQKMALRGVKVLEMAGLAPVPMCGMVLSDFGADVIRIDRAGGGALNYDVTARGKRSIALNVKHDKGREIVRDMAAKVDVILEPFRPGVMEKLGLGPNDLMTPENPGLIYARLTGFGQSGPYKDMAGHDINYLALSGVLNSLGRKNENPLAPINLLADFAGGSFVCAMGIMAALLERGVSGKGQVVDSCMVEGAAYVGSWLFASRDMFVWGQPRGHNMLDSGVHFYETYQTSDNRYMSVGCIEPQFYETFLEKLGFSDDDLPQFDDFDELKTKVAEIFKTKTRDEWCKVFDGTDACVTPVLSQEEAPSHPQNLARNSFLPGGMPRPAPVLSRTPASASDSSNTIEFGLHTREVLLEEGLAEAEVDDLIARGVVGQAEPKAKL